jgi:hypothetical protein
MIAENKPPENSACVIEIQEGTLEYCGWPCGGLQDRLSYQ